MIFKYLLPAYIKPSKINFNYQVNKIFEYRMIYVHYLNEIKYLPS